MRKDDSFRSFEEVFEIAARNNADLVLLGKQGPVLSARLVQRVPWPFVAALPGVANHLITLLRPACVVVSPSQAAQGVLPEHGH